MSAISLRRSRFWRNEPSAGFSWGQINECHALERYPPNVFGAFPAMSLRQKVKEGLDETRLLILGTQVLFGFKLTSVFQEGFAELSHVTRIVDCAGQFLMA